MKSLLSKITESHVSLFTFFFVFFDNDNDNDNHFNFVQPV